jgi:hypothetical protein
MVFSVQVLMVPASPMCLHNLKVHRQAIPPYDAVSLPQVICRRWSQSDQGNPSRVSVSQADNARTPYSVSL